jgi:hypothetical protein
MRRGTKIGKAVYMVSLLALAITLSHCASVVDATSFRATITDKQGNQTQVASLTYYYKPVGSNLLKRIEGEQYEAAAYIVGKVGDSSFSTIPLQKISSFKTGGNAVWEVTLRGGQVIKFQPEKAILKGRTDIGGDIEILSENIKQVDFHHSPSKKCPIDNKVIYDETWKYCPFDGKELVKL